MPLDCRTGLAPYLICSRTPLRLRTAIGIEPATVRTMKLYDPCRSFPNLPCQRLRRLLPSLGLLQTWRLRLVPNNALRLYAFCNCNAVHEPILYRAAKQLARSRYTHANTRIYDINNCVGNAHRFIKLSNYLISLSLL